MSPSETVAPLFQDPRLSALGLRHGLTLRALGNMKTPEARRQALEQAGLGGRAARLLKQVHGSEIREARLDDDQVAEADGWIVSDPRVVACIYAADCLPIFISDQHGRTAGVFHAGWRGLAAGMPKAAVQAFEKR